MMQQYFFDTATVGASIGILVNGKSYLYNYGETVKGNKQLPTNKSIYEIGSISKTFTASLLALAVLEGKVKLSDPVNKYLPKDIPPLQFNNKPITLQSLSNHTSGLPYMPTNLNNTDSFNLFKDYDNKALFDLLKTFKLTREAGEQYKALRRRRETSWIRKPSRSSQSMLWVPGIEARARGITWGPR